MIKLGKRLNPNVEVNEDNLKTVSIVGNSPYADAKIEEFTRAILKKYKKSHLILVSPTPDKFKFIHKLSRYRVAISQEDVHDRMDIIRGEIKVRRNIEEKLPEVVIVIDQFHQYESDALKTFIGEVKQNINLGFKIVLADDFKIAGDFDAVLDFKADTEEFVVQIGNESTDCK